MECGRAFYLSGRTALRDGAGVQRIVIGCVIAAIAVLAIWHPAPRPPQIATPVPAAPRAARPHAPARPSVLVVYVAGEVTHPGLYRLHPGDRVADAVRLAGGLRSTADPIAVNLAARLNDGDEVAVPAPGAPVRAGRRSTRAAVRQRKTREAPAAPVSVNDADAAALALVPGIGPILAQRIVEIRERDGRFASLDELLDVAGMTPARLARANQYLIL